MGEYTKLDQRIPWYICNGTQLVILNGSDSDNIPVSSGVPQGVLGPVLFLAYINDIPDIR